MVGQRGGCIVVDSTRKGKRFPDSMSKTIPIWTCVLNRAIERWLRRMPGGIQGDGETVCVKIVVMKRLLELESVFVCLISDAFFL